MSDSAPQAAPVPPKESSVTGLLGGQGRLSLRIKGVISLLVVVVYVGITTAILTEERLKLPAIVKDLEQLHKIEDQASQINMQLTRAIIATSEAYFIEQGDIRTRQLFMEMAPLETTLGNLIKHAPALKPHQEQLARLTRELAHQPSKSILEAMHTGLHKAVQELGNFTQGLRNEKQKLLANYQLVHDKLTVETLLFSFLGIMMVGGVMTIFFTRLTWDIRRAGLRAMAIVKGYRGVPLEVTRGDEVGGLMLAINQMQSELRERERELEISRQQQFHQEKMAAVGSLAAAVAHEINNPIMAISGLAQVMLDQSPVGMTEDQEIEGVPAMILEQAKRISSITRHISEFATPQSHDPQLVDLNAIVRSTANFVRFDQRYRRIDLEISEDKQLGAVFAVADHIAQILINLMFNSADALESVEDRKRKVRIETAQRAGMVELRVEDNGCGMSEEVLAHACDEFYTTKPRGKGSGLGLFLSKNLLAQNGASLSIESTPEVGTKVIMRFTISSTRES
jgi:two-component system, NtrC family, sensor kinase